MAEAVKNELNNIQRSIFEYIGKNDINGFQQTTAQLVGGPNFVDENGMTPLQHACCKGNKEAVQILMDMVCFLLGIWVFRNTNHLQYKFDFNSRGRFLVKGADINFSQHGADYTPLHFAALSGNIEVCRLLLDAGINPNSLNSVSRTASQMAAFVGNYSCVEVINNYVPRKQLEYYTQVHGQQKEPLILPSLLDAFHSFVIEVNLHPVRIALNAQSFGLTKILTGMRKALQVMCEKEMKKTSDVNELMAFKFHYLSWIIGELLRCEEQCKLQRKEKPSSEPEAANESAGKLDYIELFVKRVLKENKNGQLDYVEFTIRDCVREFPFRECTVFRQVVSSLAGKDPPPALSVLRNSINGQRGFVDIISSCSTCGNEKPDKKCSKCKVVQYCDRECQRLHWFMHKKTCARPHVAPVSATASSSTPIDSSELHDELAKLRTVS